MLEGQDKMKWNLSARQFLQLKRPCVYVWWRGDECLYVGKGEGGINRPFTKEHHVINTIDMVKEEDSFTIIFPEIAPDTSIELWECYYIDKFKPIYNQNKPNYEKCEDSRVSAMRNAVRDKKKLAEILFSKMPDDILLAHSRGDTDAIAKLTRTELEVYLARVQSDLRILELIKKAK
jgi:hypothetical protein